MGMDKIGENKQVYNDEPLFNIGVVSRMTGISMANLRAWERRYNFPETKRTEGGHRLYSEYDLYKLKWVKEKISNGMQTAAAINLFRYQEKNKQFEPTETVQEKENITDTEKNRTLSSFKLQLVDALINKKLSMANDILGNALTVYTPEEIIINIIAPATAEIGKKWEKNQISISVEHLVTNYLRQRLMMWMLSSPPSRLMKPVLLACAPQEWHEGSLLILGTLLRRKRIPIVYLGQSVPLADLSLFISDINPSFVVLVAMGEDSARALSELPKYFPNINQSDKLTIGYGGHIFVAKPEFRLIVPAVYLGDTFAKGINNIEQIIKSSIG